MPNLSIKNVPEHLLKKLRERAARHHRSLQGELMALICAAIEPRPGPPEGSTEAEPPTMRGSGTRRIEDIAAQHRRRWEEPFDQGPQAVDVLRAERDAR